MSSVEQITIFLLALFGEDLDGRYILVWTNPGRKSAFFATIHDAAAYAAAQQGVNVYFGICLSPEDMGADRRCQAERVAVMPGLWADIDIADASAHAKTNLPTTVAEAKSLLAALPLPPTMTIHSGHGLQAYWLFKEPWDIDNDVERAEAAALSKGFNELVLADAKRLGWVVDMTFDLARVFRLPGTQNVKDPANPKPVTILEHFDERRYNPDDFPEYFPEDITAYTVEMERDRRYLDIRLTRNPIVNQIQLEQSWDIEPRFKATWLHKRKDLADQSMSSYDMSLTAYAVQCGWTDQQIADLIVAFRMRHGDAKDQKKAFRMDYVSTTIKNARRKFGASDKQIAADATILDTTARMIEDILSEPDQDDAPKEEDIVPQESTPNIQEGSKQATGSTKDQKTAQSTSGDKKALLESLAAKLGVPVTRLIKYKVDPPVFAIVLGRKEVKLGKIENLVVLGKFRMAVAESVGVLIPSKIKGWDQIAQAMLCACDNVTMSDEDSGRGRVRGWIEGHLDVDRPSQDWEDACKARKPFIKDGKLHIFLKGLRKFLAGEGEKFETGGVLSTELRRHGCIPHVQGIEVEGKPTTRNVYIVPDALAVSYEVERKDSYGMKVAAPTHEDEAASPLAN